jgi:hypothetical protein
VSTGPEGTGVVGAGAIGAAAVGVVGGATGAVTGVVTKLGGAVLAVVGAAAGITFGAGTFGIVFVDTWVDFDVCGTGRRTIRWCSEATASIGDNRGINAVDTNGRPGTTASTC